MPVPCAAGIQCEVYEDFGYDIDDDNKDKDMRKFEMTGSLPSGCLIPNHRAPLPQYNVTFKTWMGPDLDPWTSDSVTRLIKVVDTDECRVDKEMLRRCPACEPQCDKEASCVNEIGSYRCKCPVCARRGDGFKKIVDHSLQPLTYVNGSGCHDSCPPEIRLLGERVIVFKVCKCEGPLCPPSTTAHVDWEKRVKDMLVNLPNALCPAGRRFPCAVASDPTDDGIDTRDISSRITVGQPIHLSGLSWKVPYDVLDESGNAAQTVYREVRIHI